MNLKENFPFKVREGSEKLVRVTASASDKIFRLIERESKGGFLRIRITGGGCNGLSYKMKFTTEPRDGDIFVLSEGVKVLVDTKTALYLRGTTLEYSDKLVAGGFKFNNPNAKASCSCGESFNL
ncbi:MAG: iron-sulfur cluster assembly accessory protein [Opitutae bacterium]|nr:iron-sulfur cluster assembly accessory protein [Opitutae bacterium]|tara:strand:+ start:239 stop:610 length:372 start_codon:yes stop_codon:yes gene_type:complete